MNSLTEMAAMRRGWVTPMMPLSAVAGLVQYHGYLGGFSRAGGAFDDDDLVVLEGVEYSVFLLIYRQFLIIHAFSVAIFRLLSQYDADGLHGRFRKRRVLGYTKQNERRLRRIFGYEQSCFGYSHSPLYPSARSASVPAM